MQLCGALYTTKLGYATNLTQSLNYKMIANIKLVTRIKVRPHIRKDTLAHHSSPNNLYTDCIYRMLYKQQLKITVHCTNAFNML